MQRQLLPVRRAARTALAFAIATILGFRAPAVHAGPEGASWQITPEAGYAYFVDPFSTFRQGRLRARDNVHFGASLGWQPTRLFGLEVGGGYTPTKIDVRNGADANFVHLHGDVLVAPLHTREWDLYVLAGGGFETFTVAGTRHYGSLDAGAGIRLWLSEHLALRGETRNILIVSVKGKPSEAHDNYVLVLGGVTWAFGGKLRDSDGDGVPDKRDACPGTPAGAHVDAKGCPIDSDGDGVADGLDQCPDTPKGAAVDAKGCPTDSDGDGVPDGLDQCSDTPRGARVNASGCPIDSDGDGVFDGLDQCPDTPKGAVVDANGCPKDSDGDGVADGLDKCPDTPPGVRVDKDGCPIEVTEKETELLDTGMIRLENINFETGKSNILPESFAALDVVGQVLTKWPELRIEVGGHTDSRGSAAYNQKLSEARANAVKNYLIQKFPALKADQFTVMGYGESKPLVPNKGALNMAKNRRVEFVVQNKEVLRREVEKRKLLKP